MFYQHNVNGNVSSRVAQRKRAGPITQRSALLALLVIVLFMKMFKGHLLSISLFPIKQIKKYISNWHQAALENALRISNSVDSDLLGSTIFLWRCWFPRFKKLSFFYTICVFHFTFQVLSNWKFRWFLNNELWCLASGLPRRYYCRTLHGNLKHWNLIIARCWEKNILCAKPKSTFIYRSRQDSNLRGKTPMEFKSIVLTTRPRLLQQCALQLSLVQ